MKEIEIKSIEFPLEIKSIAEDGIFSGYASVFDVVDNQRDVVLHGAFGSDIKTRAFDIKLLWQHKADEPIGIITRLEEDEYGLYIEGHLLLDVARANEAYALMKSGAVTGLSIGFKTNDYVNDYDTGIRYLKALELWEVSLVTFPANPDAVIRTVKQAPATLREFEDFLRDAGFSRKQAKTIAIKGFNQADMRDAYQEEEASAFMATVSNAVCVLTT